MQVDSVYVFGFTDDLWGKIKGYLLNKRNVQRTCVFGVCPQNAISTPISSDSCPKIWLYDWRPTHRTPPAAEAQLQVIA